MKQKIIAALKTTYAKLGLSNEAFDGVASLLEKTVKEEADIATAVSGDDVKALLKTIQGQTDSWKNKYYDKEKELNGYKEAHPDKDTKTPEPDKGKGDEEPEWAKKLREQNEAIAARFKADDDARRLSTARANVEAKLKADGCTNPGILALTLKGFALGEKETEEDAAARLKSEYDASYKETFGSAGAPGFATPAFGDSKDAIKAKNDFLRSKGLLPDEK